MRPPWLRLALIVVVAILSSITAQGSSTIDSLQQILEGSPSDSIRVGVLNELSFIYWYNDPELSKAYAEKAYDLASQNKDYSGSYDAIISLANFHLVTGKYDQAAELYRKNLEAAKAEKDTFGMGIGFMNLGVALHYQSRPAEALENYFQSLDILAIDSLTEFGTLYMNIGSIYQDQKKYTIADEYYHRALAEVEKPPIDDELYSFILISIAENHMASGNLELAFPNIERALSKASVSGTKSIESSAYTLYGRYFFEQGKNSYAESYFEKAEVIEQEINSTENRIINNYHWAKMKYATGDLLESEKLYLQAYQLAKGSRDLTQLMICGEGLSQLYAELGKNAEAYQYLNASRLYRDSLNTLQNTFDIGRLESRHLFEKASLENKMLKQQQALQAEKHESQIQQQRMWSTIGILTVILLLVIVFTQQRAFQQRAKAALAMKNKNTEIAQQQDQILRQKEDLVQLNRVKDQIFSMVSHDLRAPLLNIKSALELTKSGLLTESESQDILSSLYMETSRNLNLLDNLLFWAKSQLEGFSVKPESIDLKELANQNIALFDNQIKNKQLQIELSQSEDQNFMAFADKDMIDLVIRNLLHNAIKFTPEKGHIELLVSCDLDFTKLTITDSGAGIDTETLDGISDPLVRISKPGTAKEKGAGLGLKICMQFIEHNGGQFSISRKNGSGTVAGFRIPARSNGLRKN